MIVFCKSLNITRTQFPYKIRISSVCRVLVAYPKDPFSPSSAAKESYFWGGGYTANLLMECLSWSLLPNLRFTESGAGRNFVWDSQAVRFSWLSGFVFAFLPFFLVRQIFFIMKDLKDWRHALEWFRKMDICPGKCCRDNLPSLEGPSPGVPRVREKHVSIWFKTLLLFSPISS